ncbi:uncharacterized protein [Notothenia coriiceps]|uniref:Serpin B6 n=1 Tax=Notothenia coriiceps TaxID=8208 RepID=A0A6I9NJB5_9TELE|nr:PREDICTED: uncharacterized protein LOC104951650 [Notothenia coriiceps]
MSPPVWESIANIFYSPFSISSALAMVMLGTGGNTSTQMSEVLGFTEKGQPEQTGAETMQLQMESQSQMQMQMHQSRILPECVRKFLPPQNDEEDVHASFSELMSKLIKDDAPYALSLANRLYGEQSYQFVERFLSETKKHYGADLESVDFKASAEAARVNINKWVEDQTQGKIKDLLAKDMVDSLTRLVLVNAIYFKGKWETQFKEYSTVDAPFKMNKNDTKSVKMMGQTSKFGLSSIREANCQILEMPYKGKDLSMLIFLPNEIEDKTTGLEKLEKELTYETFVEWTRPDVMVETKVNVNLPRFKMEESCDLKDILISMGMVDAFDVTMSDFSGMSKADDLVLSAVVHKAFVEVNEEGTEAAAATAGVASEPQCRLSSMQITPSSSSSDTTPRCFKHETSCNGKTPEHSKSIRKVSVNTMASPTPLSKANTTFALALLKQLGDNDNATNVFYSPFSISSALAMVMLGTRGNTFTQISEVLCFTEPDKSRHCGGEQMQMEQQQKVNAMLPPYLRKMCLKTKGLQDEVHTRFAELLSELNRENAPFALSVANRLYGEQSYQFVEDFLGKTKKHYSAELEPTDFVNSSEVARGNINNWVEQMTQGKIKDLLAKGVLDSMTRMVLVNAIYFKGNWDKQFEESKTVDSQFRLNKNGTKPVKMMNMKSKFPFTYISEASCQILEMPYKGKELSMLIFLPKDIEDSTTGLEKLEKQLTYENFTEWTRPEMMDNVEVMVGLPRFKMEELYDLKNVLVSMGMADAFDMAMSDFSGMAPGNDLVLSKVVHKAFVEVNEEGTEAAAATAAIMMLRCAPMRPESFVADHPFLFFIRHNPSMSVLFAGRYCSPE